MTISWNITPDTITVYLPNGPRTAVRTPELLTAVQTELAEGNLNPDLDRLEDLFNPLNAAKLQLEDSDIVINPAGTQVTYRGMRIPEYLESKLLDIVAQGFNVKAWKLFVKRVYANPSRVARQELALFMDAGNLPVTEDGCFLAYKRVSEDYKDLRTGTFDNSVGATVTMPRNDVDDNRQNLCSRGLHFCSREYLRSFGGARTVVVKIDPADVVSIPSDYNNTKGRTWKYVVVDEILEDATLHTFDVPVYGDYNEGDWAIVDEDGDVVERFSNKEDAEITLDEDYYGDNFSVVNLDEDDDSFIDEDDLFEDERDEDDAPEVVVNPNAFVRPQEPTGLRGWWNRVRTR